jgi:membrane-associated phospholipid phosphatase
MNFLNWLKSLDHTLFFYINNKFTYSPLNQLMLLLREPLTWVPVYLFFLLFFLINCRKYFVPIVLLTLLTFALSDFTSATIIKPFVGRLRPCYDVTITGVNNIAGCGGPFSMPSSHAANHFGLSTFWFLIVRHLLNRRWYWLWLWAFIIGYAQIFVGVHFPGDIVVGGLLGVAFGYLSFYLFKRWTNSEETELVEVKKTKAI